TPVNLAQPQLFEAAGGRGMSTSPAHEAPAPAPSSPARSASFTEPDSYTQLYPAILQQSLPSSFAPYRSPSLTAPGPSQPGSPTSPISPRPGYNAFSDVKRTTTSAKRFATTRIPEG